MFCNLPKVRPVGLAAPTVRPVEALVAVVPNPPKLSPVEAVVFGALNAKPVLLPKEIPLAVVEVVPVPNPPKLSPVEAVVFGALNAKPVLLPKEIPLAVVEVVPVPKPPRPASVSIHLEYNISNTLI